MNLTYVVVQVQRSARNQIPSEQYHKIKKYLIHCNELQCHTKCTTVLLQVSILTSAITYF